MLYPLLLERVPEQAAMTEEVAHEQQVVQTSLDIAVAACSTWRQHPTVETAEALAASLDHLNEVLQPHLDDEEQQVVPLAAVTLTQEEWDAVGEPAGTSWVMRTRLSDAPLHRLASYERLATPVWHIGVQLSPAQRNARNVLTQCLRHGRLLPVNTTDLAARLTCVRRGWTPQQRLHIGNLAWAYAHGDGSSDPDVRLAWGDPLVGLADVWRSGEANSHADVSLYLAPETTAAQRAAAVDELLRAAPK